MNEKISEADLAAKVELVLSRCDQNDARVKSALRALASGQPLSAKRSLQSYAESIVIDPETILSLTEEALVGIRSNDLASLDKCRDRLVIEAEKIRLKNEILRLCDMTVALLISSACCHRVPMEPCVSIRGEALLKKEVSA